MKNKTNKQCITVVSIMAACSLWSANSMANDIYILTERILVDLVDSKQRIAQGRGQTLTEKASDIILAQNSSGCWDEYDYLDSNASDEGGWEPIEHIYDVQDLAAEYRVNGDATVKNALLKAIDCWYEDNPSGSVPVSPNWYHNEISLPKSMGPVGLIIKQDLNQTQLSNVVSTMPVSAPAIGTGTKSEGANRTNIGLGVIYRGMLLGDSAKVSEGVLTIEDSIALGQGSGYIQSDYSWLQHGPQLYNAGYGKSWKASSVDFAYYIRDLQWAIPQEKMAIVASYLLDGEQWMIMPGGKARFDYNTIGRAIGRAPNPDPVVVPPSTIDITDAEKVAAMVPSKASELQAYQNYREGSSPAQTGFKHFWRSDYSVVMRDDFMYTIRMSSDDVTLLEHGNGENLLGYWLGFGNTFLYQSGDEYDNIFPVWEWDEIPGVTSAHFTKTRNKAWGNNYQDSTFVGAVTDGQYGVTVMDMVHTDDDSGVKDLFAKKAWFAFEDEIVALGSGISSSRSEYISTTVNQSLLDGPVTIDGVEYAEGGRDLNNVDWIHHDNVGYVFPASWWGQVSNNTQTGSWSLVDTEGTTETLSAKTFRIRMGHSWQPSDRSYQYIIVPSVTKGETQAYSDATPVTIIENSEEIQAVRHAGLNMTGIVFYKAGSVTVYDGLTVSVTAPSVILLDESGTEPVVSLSTPGTSGTVLVTLTYADKGTYTKMFSTSSSVDELGKTVSAVIDGSSSNNIEVTPTDDSYVRDGVYADDNFGSASSLTVKEDGIGYARQSFFRFDLSSYNGSVAEAKLVLDANSIGSDISNASFTAYLMENDNWSEESLTHNNAEIGGTAASTKTFGTTGAVEWDVTGIVNQQINSDKIITIKVESNSAGANKWVHFSSKESNNAPKLVISSNNIDVTPTDDSYIRDGVYAGDNFGSASKLTVKEDGIGYARQSFFRFDLSAFNENVAEAKLVLKANAVGSDISNTSFTAYLMENDNWSEESLTHNNAETSGTAASTITFGQTGSVEWDVTGIVNQQINSDKIITIKVESNSAGPNKWVDFSSEEGSTPPKLTMSLN